MRGTEQNMSMLMAVAGIGADADGLQRSGVVVTRSLTNCSA